MLGVIICALFIFFIFLIIFLITFFFNHSLKLKTGVHVPFRDKTYFSTEYIYLVTFITGQRPCAGTLADIYLRLHGECTSSEIFKLDDASKGLLQRGAIDKYLIFSKESLGHITRVEIQVDAHGKHDQDWFLSEVIVQDPQHYYRPYIFTCCQWFKGGGCTYKHYLVGPKDYRTSYLRTFWTSLTRGLIHNHIWLAVIFDNRHGRRFNGCTASVILYQLMSNLLLFNLVPAVIPDHITHDDLVYYTFPFNLVAAIIAAILEIITRNIRPRIVCICPFHHDWDAERVAYRNAVKIEIAKNKLDFKSHPTYESLLKCLTEDEWRRARGIARGAWQKMRNDAVTDEVLDDVIKTFLYRSAQKICRRAAYEDQKLRCNKEKMSGRGWEDKHNRNQSAVTFEKAMHSVINNMEIEFTDMLNDMKVSPNMSSKINPYLAVGTDNIDEQWFSTDYFNDTKGGHLNTNRNATTSAPLASSSENMLDGDLVKPDTPLLDKSHTKPYSNNVYKRKNDTKLNEATSDSDDKHDTLIYTIKDGEKMNEDSRVNRTRVLFMSDLEFIVKSSQKDTLSCIKLHNSLSKAVAYEIRANNPKVYEIHPNIGLIPPHKTTDINVWLLTGYEVKVVDSILITVRPVDAYYCDPSQIRWLWKTANKNTILQYVLNCREIVPHKIKEPLELTTQHSLQLELEMNGEHTKFFVPWAFLSMGDEEVTEWLRLFGVALLEHIFGFEIIKLVLLAICATVLRKNWLIFT